MIPSYRSLRVLGAVLLLSTGCKDADRASANEPPTSYSVQDAAPCDVAEVTSSSENAEFSLINALDVDSQGRIYVGDWGQKAVIVLSPTGEVIRRIGREGGGPGEFKWIRDVQILPGDSMLVYDFGLNRITVFAPGSDSVAYTINVAAASPLPPPMSVVKVPDRGIYVARVIKPFNASGDDPAEDYKRNQVVRLLNAEGSVVRDSLLSLPAPQDAMVARSGGAVAAMPNPFGRPGRLEVGPDGRIYYGEGNSLAIDIYSLGGKRIGGFSAPHEPPPITDADIAGILDSEARRERFWRAAEEFRSEVASGRWPAFRNFAVDDRSRVWVGLITPSGQPTQWVVFDGSGAPICSVALPENVELRLVRSGRGYGVVTDEFTDVPRVVVYQITAIQAETQS